MSSAPKFFHKILADLWFLFGKMQPHMDRTIVQLEMPIDYLLETDSCVVACSYEFKDDARRGGLYFLDKDNLTLLFFKETSGTLCACYNNGVLYTANAKDISAFNGFDLIAIRTTPELNTCIAIDKDLYAGNICGSIRVFDSGLNEKKEVKITTNPIWTIKARDGVLYVGDEAGSLFIYDEADGSVSRIVDRESKKGLIDIIVSDKTFAVSSYDEDLIVYSKAHHHQIIKYESVGALWKMIQWEQCVVSSSIYGGVRIFDKDYNLIKLIETETICYGICIVGKKLVWAPYYNNRIEWIDLETLLNE